MSMRNIALAGVLFGMTASFSPTIAAPYPPADQKRPPLVIQNHGVFWAGGKIVKRTQTGTFAAGDQKALAFRDQEVLVG